MTATELRLEFPAYTPVLIADAGYAKPTLRWLQDVFWPWFRADRERKGLRSWTRRNDCDNFARAYAQGAADCHAITAGNDQEGLAVGEYWYHSRNGLHAVVIAFTDQGRVYIEPQTGERLQVTQQEEQSCIFARF